MTQDAAPVSFQPRMYVQSVRPFAVGSELRYFASLSDGTSSIKATLLGPEADLVRDGTIAPNVLVQLTDFDVQNTITKAGKALSVIVVRPGGLAVLGTVSQS